MTRHRLSGAGEDRNLAGWVARKCGYYAAPVLGPVRIAIPRLVPQSGAIGIDAVGSTALRVGEDRNRDDPDYVTVVALEVQHRFEKVGEDRNLKCSTVSPSFGTQHRFFGVGEDRNKFQKDQTAYRIIQAAPTLRGR